MIPVDRQGLTQPDTYDTKIEMRPYLRAEPGSLMILGAYDDQDDLMTCNQ